MNIRKISQKILLGIGLFLFLSLYSFCVYYVSIGGKKLGWFTKPLQVFAQLPERVYRTYRPIYPEWTYNSQKGDSFNIKSTSFGPSLFGLSSSYDQARKKWNINLLDFKRDLSLFTWEMGGRELSIDDMAGSFPHMPILMPDSGLIIFFQGTKNLLRIDKKSQILWHNEEFVFHHTMNLDSEGHLWICGFDNRGIYNPKTHKVSTYLEDVLLKIDVNSGKIIQKISLVDLLWDNGQKELILRYSNRPNTGDDPLHSNDVQPVFSSSTYWETGDLFVSLRNRSLILHIRPSSGELINFIQGPFINQHDVDIISPTEIAFFHNNFSMLGDKTIPLKDQAKRDTLGPSEILVFNFEDGSFSPILDSLFEEEQIFSATQSHFEILPSGRIFVESQNEGLLYLFSEDEILMKKTLPSPVEGHISRPHWIRVFE